MTTTFKTIVATALMGTIAAGSLATTADAGGRYRGYHHGGNSAYVYQNNSGYGQGPRAKFRNHREYGHHSRHKNRGLAVGAVAAILGLAIAASAANAHNDRDYDDRDYDRRDYRGYRD